MNKTNDNKSKDNNSNIRTSTEFLDFLSIAFIVLKLCNVIDWPWIWVLCPLWAQFLIGILIIIIYCIIAWFKGELS